MWLALKNFLFFTFDILVTDDDSAESRMDVDVTDTRLDDVGSERPQSASDDANAPGGDHANSEGMTEIRSEEHSQERATSPDRISQHSASNSESGQLKIEEPDMTDWNFWQSINHLLYISHITPNRQFLFHPFI